MRLCLPVLLLLLASCGPDEPPGATASTEPLPPCGSPGSPGFDDVVATSGVDFVSEIPEFEEVGGVAAADLDDDGAVDVLLFQRMLGRAYIYWGQGDGTFEPADPLPAPDPEDEAMGVSVIDFDGDGDLDVMLLGPDTLRLYRNGGDRSFVDVASDVGLAMGPRWGGGAAWGDVDGDGDLDLFVQVMQDFDDDEDRGGPDDDDLEGEVSGGANLLFRNDDGAFAPLSGGPTEAAGLTHHSVFADFDGDGDSDLLVLNDFGFLLPGSELWERDGDAWIDHGAVFGVLDNPMGAWVEDLDGDGLLDIWTSDIDDMRVFAGAGSFDFVEVTTTWLDPADHAPQDVSWSLLPVDPDGDGGRDVFVSYGRLRDGLPGPPEPEQPDRLYSRTEGSGGAPLFRVDAGGLPSDLPTLDARGGAAADFDGDGVPDVIVRNMEGPPHLLKGRCTDARRLVVALRDTTTPNTRGVGARVAVDGRVQVVPGGGPGTYSASQPELYFGVGAADAVSIEVTWPDGAVELFEDVCAPCRIRITR